MGMSEKSLLKLMGTVFRSFYQTVILYLIKLRAFIMIRLVTRLGLKSNLTDYKVPVADLPKIAGGALGTQDGPDFLKVVKILEGLYV